MLTITATRSTLLKKLPQDSQHLSAGQVKAVPVGKSYDAVAIEPTDNSGHAKVILAYGQGTWYIFRAHWSGPDLLTKAKAEYIFERGITTEQLASLNNCLAKYQINTSSRMRHFLSQIAHESAGLQYMVEIWGPTQAQLSYEGRSDLGNYKPGDGSRFRGVGPLQVTGRANYEAFARSIGDARVLEGYKYVAEHYPFEISGFWWADLNDMNSYCDSNPSVANVTLRVNGGYNGLASRENYYRRCLDVIA